LFGSAWRFPIFANAPLFALGIGLTVPLQVADTCDSVRQGTPDPRQGNNPTCFDPDSVLGTFFQPVISGSQALKKGGRHDHIEASGSSFP
jgi:hypothetical protein